MYPAPVTPAAVLRERTVHRPAPVVIHEPIAAPPPAAVPFVRHDEPPVLIDDAPQISSGGTAAPKDEHPQPPGEPGIAFEPVPGTPPAGTGAGAAAPLRAAQAPGTDVSAAETAAPMGEAAGAVSPTPAVP